MSRAPREDRAFRVVGDNVPRADGPDKVTGAAAYASDLVLPNMLHARLVRSAIPHGRLVRVAVDRATAHPGVVAVVTGRDLDGFHPYYGHIVRDRPVLAIDRVRFAGEPVAIAIGVDEWSADEGAELVEVEYEEWPAVFAAEHAMRPSAPVLHPAGGYEVGAMRGFAEAVEAGLTPNLCHEATLAWGDVDAAFGQAARVFADTFRFPMVFHYTMEPYGAVASWSEGGLTVWSSAQHPFMVRAELSRLFDLPLNRVRIVVPYVGGGYGGKSYTKVEPLAAVAARAAGRPVRLVLDVDESFLTTRCDAATVTVRTAVTASGRLLARDIDIAMNTGAYAENSPLVVRKAVNRALGPYRIPNARVRGRLVYTNTAPASSFRGFGAPQVVWAGESQMDIIAEALGLDAVDLRMRNIASRGDELLPGLRPLDADLPGDLALLAERVQWGRPLTPNHGRGVACSASDAGAEPVSTAMVRVNADGSVTVLVGTTELGQGSRTVFAQIAAEELGVDYAQVKVVGSDTDLAPYDRSTGASRSTTVVGLALQDACRDARRDLVRMAAETAGVDEDAVVEVPGGVEVGGARLSWSEVIGKYFALPAGEVVGRGHVRRAGALAPLPVFWEIGMTAVEVSVDVETGLVRVEQLATVGDVGKAVHPASAESQDLGAATMGMGIALFEEIVYEDGQMLNNSMLQYRVPRIGDLPPRVDLTLVENRDGPGPYGLKGGGEGALNPVAPAVANAIARAVGVRLREAPMTPPRVWAALQAGVRPTPKQDL
jgi:CO/xanthine dehydrogenase Mo-binding subunit